MSSEEDNGSPSPARSKRTRMHGACDQCRQKKIRCDSAKRPGKKCTNCVNCSSECTHVHANQRVGQGSRATSFSSSEPASLAQERERMDPLLKSILLPKYQAPSSPAVIRETLVKLARYARALEATLQTKAPKSPTQAPSLSSTMTPTPLSSSFIKKEPEKCELDGEITDLSEHLKHSLYLNCLKDRFFGPSSNITLLETALEVSVGDCKRSQPTKAVPMKHLRPEFWSTLPWEKPAATEDPVFNFPDPDLIDSLVDIFFTNLNVYIPVLHRPTLERGIKDGLHHSDSGFASVLLAVCAVASRYSIDERVLLEGSYSTHSCGFKWFRQIKHFHESSLRAPSLYELQALALSVAYLKGSSTPEKSWYLVGFGVRAALDIGLHKKPKNETAPTVEGELRKRLFWVLMMGEVQTAVMAGRPPAVNPEDFDVDMPLAVDDEYWENPDPTLAFKQPPGKPAQAEFFNSFVDLLKIHFEAHRFFYSVKRSAPPAGISVKEHDRSKLAEIDSSLNAWVDSVPAHLRWEGSRSPDSKTVFFDQSALLFTQYYYIQILVHRPFIGSQDEPVLAFSSLAICTNAARACIRIMETQSKKGSVPTPHVVFALFASGLMLLLGMWTHRRTGCKVLDNKKDAGAVRSCIDLLEMYESRWHCAGRFRDLLMALCSIGGLALTEPEISKAVKRSRTDLSDEEEQRNTRRRSSATDPFMSNRPATEELSVMHSPSSGTSPSSLDTPSSTSSSDDQTRYQFPFYSSDLSKPFPQFPLAAGGDNAALEKQLDDLEAMMGDINQLTQADLAFLNNGVPPSQGFGDSTFASSVMGAAGFLPGSNPPAPPHTAPGLDQGYGNSSFSDGQPVAMWTGVPAGYELDDWNDYIANLEALNGAQPSSDSTLQNSMPSFVGTGSLGVYYGPGPEISNFGWC